MTNPQPDVEAQLEEIIQQHRYDVEKLPPAEAFGNAKDKLQRLMVRERLRTAQDLDRVVLLAATKSTHDTLPVVIASDKFVKDLQQSLRWPEGKK